MINVRKELFDVAFQNPAGSRVVLARLAGEQPKAVQRSVRALPNPARKRIGDKRLLEKGVQYAGGGVMQKAVAHRCFVNIPRLGIGDVERMIAAVTIRTAEDIGAKRKYLVHEVERKFLNVMFPALAAQKLPPRFE